MKRVLIIALLMISVYAIFGQTRTCREIQETTVAGDGTYPSPYASQVVTVQGIVTGTNFYTSSSNQNYRGFYICDEGGGEWSGLLIYTTTYNPTIGDKVSVTGTIVDYYGFTEMSPVTAYQVLSTGNTVPDPVLVSTLDLSAAATAEKYESCLVRVENVNVTSLPSSNYQEFNVSDGSGNCQVDNQFFTWGHTWGSTIATGQTWAEIRGIVDYSYSYGLNPRGTSDMIREYSLVSSTIRVPSVTSNINEEVKVSVTTTKLQQNYYVENYTMKIKIDPTKVEFLGVDRDSTLSADPACEVVTTLSAAGDTISIFFDYYLITQNFITAPANDAVLLKLIFRSIQYGENPIQLVSFMYNDVDIAQLVSGKIVTPIRKKLAFLNIANDRNSKNIFNPAYNEKITIQYGYELRDTGINAKAIVRIYDVQGRLMHTLVNKNISSPIGIETYLWDGRDDKMNLLPIGLYYCHLEIIERSGSGKETAIQPIVIGTKLK